MSLKKLNYISQKHIHAAGPRYSPSLDPNAPNLEIKSLLNAVEALSLSDRYRDMVMALRQEVTKSWKNSSKATSALFVKGRTPLLLVDLLNRLQRQRAGRSEMTLREIDRKTKLFIKKLDKKRNELWEQERETKEYSEEQSAIQAELASIRRLESSLRQVLGFIRSPDFHLVNTNRMLILGEWGTGKTHFLCDITKDRMSRKLPTLFLLAHRLPLKEDPLSAICKSTQIAQTPLALLRHMNSLGKEYRGRALIIIDGINEASRPVWYTNVRKMAQLISQYPNVGIILSCRNPFDQQIFTARARRTFIETYHNGFQDIEFDAQRAFFEYYRIPNPHIPLLTPEFSRPLFLKILCLTFSGKTEPVKNRWIREIAAGQKTMTKVFEDFVVRIGSRIEADFGLQNKTCWRILKGHKMVTGEVIGIAVSLAKQLQNYISPQECLSIIKKITGLQKDNEAQQIFEKMATEGLIIEDVIWEDRIQKSIIRLPYQRFSDHLIARYLIDNYLNTSSEKTIRQSFYRNKPLGKIFDINRHRHSYRMPGLASAVMLEFPERVKRVLPAAERELVFYLPRQMRLLSPLVDIFLEGLLWRNRDSFSKQTDIIVDILIKQGGVIIQRNTLEALVSLACRPGHPYSAEVLRKYLLKKQLTERDLLWSEFLRNAYESSVIYRLLDWIVRPGLQTLNEDSSRNILVLLSLFLTTTHRPLRDRTTKSLVLIGEKYPKVIFNATLESLKFNDPYVPERMLAASYGVAMRSWAFPSKIIKDALPILARKIYDAMFSSQAPYPTKHILSRDYALGIIELAQKIQKSCLGRRPLKNLKHPFGNGAVVIPSPEKISEDYCEPANNAIHMDFENYTIGRLVSNRRNYDSNHEEYKGVLRQIKWRILVLGYDSEKFNKIDKQISRDSFYREQRDRVGKIDRYGKKYSWIAFFEVAGIRDDLGLLPDRYRSRISDCDIDPSFPEDLRMWKPPLNKFLTSRFTTAHSWALCGKSPSYDHLLQFETVDGLNGPWVLLNGFISESAPKDPRQVFTFLNGRFVNPSNISKLRHKFNLKKYPGNKEIPGPWEDYYTFAGEIPWSKKYGLEYSLGKSKRNIEECFSEHKTFTICKKVTDLSKFEKLSLAIKSIPDLSENSIVKTITPEEKNKKKLPKYVDIPRYKTIPGVPVEVPIHSLSWESYHSTENQGGGADYLAPALCDFLKLRNKSNFQDLFDASGNQATIFRIFRNDTEYFDSNLFYIRKDLLRKYLLHTEQKLVWFIWGERNFKFEFLETMRNQLQNIWTSYGYIFKKMKVARLS